MAGCMPHKVRKLVVYGPKNSGKTSWFHVFLGIISIRYMASITQEKQFSTCMLKADTQIVFLDEWSENSLQSDMAKAFLQGGYMPKSTKHKEATFVLNNSPYYTVLQNRRQRWLGAPPPPPPPPPPIIFEPYVLLQQTIYRWKRNLTANMIHFKYLKNILILRFYQQFLRNGSAMAPEPLFEKISNLYDIITYHFKALYIILKHVVWRFRIYNYFRKIFKFHDFMNT